MYKTRKPTTRGLKIILITTCALFALFWVFALIFGGVAANSKDVDLKGGIGDVFAYHFKDAGNLFSFSFHQDSKNIMYFTLSGLLYFFIIIAILYLIVGILITVKKKRLTAIPGMVAALLVILVFIFVSGGTPKYWLIVNQRSAFENDQSLIFPTFAILAISSLYIVSSYALYFLGLYEALKNPVLAEEESTKKQAQNIEENQAEKAVLFEAIDEESLDVENAEKQIEYFDENKEVQEEQTEEENMGDKEDLKALLREVVRDIVRDEIARNNANQPKSDFNPNSGGSVTGATFGGPLVVQYFNGGIQGVPATSAPAPEVKKEEPQPVEEEAAQEEAAPVEEAPVEEAQVEDPQPEAAPVEEAIAEVQPEEIVAPVEEAPAEEKKPIIRIPFTERMLSADKEMQDNYNELKNEILSYGVNSRVSNSGDTFRLHRKTYVKITIAGLSLKLYFALNPDDYKDSTLPIQNAGHKGIYEEIPLVFKVKSGLSMRRCKQLIQDVFDKNGFEQGEIANTNWVEELKNAPSDEGDED